MTKYMEVAEMTLGEQIKLAREGRNMSQEELADQMGVSRQAVSKWENDASVPQGVNRDMLSAILDLEFTKQETEQPKKTGIVWIGSIVAVLLLVAVVGIGFRYRNHVLNNPQAEASEGDENISFESVLTDVQFYDDNFERVRDNSSWYNSAEINCILLQWDRGTPLHVKMLFMPVGMDTSEQTELLLTKNILEGSSAVLLSADVIRSRREGKIYFEFDFGDSLVVSEQYSLFYEADPVVVSEEPASEIPEILVYIDSMEDGVLSYDAIEWVSVPGRRAAELGLEENESGFFIYNEDIVPEQSALADDCVYIVLDWMNSYEPLEVTKEEMTGILMEREGMDIPYILKIEGNEIVGIEEHYLP